MRRSKEDSLKTRRSIVLAARRVFAKHGVSRTTMEHIAEAAGVTRGAIYGHFAGKSELFQSMREEVKLPLVDAMNEALLHSPDDPLTGVERYLVAVIDLMRNDAATRQTFHILGFKCEYVGEIEVDMKRQVARSAELIEKLEAVYRTAARKRSLRKGITPRLAALETCAFLVGLVRLWLLDSASKVIRKETTALIRAHVDNLRAGAR
jgi:TetR/AcrR family acrAB operon transcriptional repressor